MNKATRVVIITLIFIAIIAGGIAVALTIHHTAKTSTTAPATNGSYPRTLPGYRIYDIRLAGNKAISMYFIPQGFEVGEMSDQSYTTDLDHNYYLADLRDQNNRQIATARVSANRAEYLSQHMLYNDTFLTPDSMAEKNILRIHASTAAAVTAFNTYAKVTDKKAYAFLTSMDHGVGYGGGIGDADTLPQPKTQAQARRIATGWHVTVIQGQVLGETEFDKDISPRVTFEDGIYVTVAIRGYDDFTVMGFDPKDNYTYTYEQTTGEFTSGKIDPAK